MDITNRYILQTSYDKTGIDRFKQDMLKADQVAKKFGVSLGQNVGIKSTESFKTVGNETKKIIKTTAEFEKAGKRVGVSWKQMGAQGQAYGGVLTKTTSKQQKFSDVLMKAGKRALLVAPIWMAIRSAMQFVIRTLSEGMKYWVEWDKALMKAKAVIHGVGGDITGAFQRLQSEVRELALATGESMAKITSAFYRFGTVGLDFETSIAGMRASVDLAMAMFGDADQIARVLAQAYRLLGDTIDSNISPMERLESIGAQLYAMWRTNAFEINEMMGALQQFLPTANTANFTLTETISLLASLQTGGLKGTRAGRLLRTSVNKLVGNLDELAGSLRIWVNPQLDSTFDVLMKVIGAVKELSAKGKLPVESMKAISTIFGGVRGAEPIKALVSLYDTLTRNLETAGGDMSKLMALLRGRVDEVTDSVSRQSQIMGELRNQIGMTFLKGMFGGEDFVETLKNINETLKDSIHWFKVLGKVVSFALQVPVAPVVILGDIQAMKIEAEARTATIMKDVYKRVEKAKAGLLTKKELLELEIDLKVAVTAPDATLTERGAKVLNEAINKAYIDQIDLEPYKKRLEEVLKMSFEDVGLFMPKVEFKEFEKMGMKIEGVSIEEAKELLSVIQSFPTELGIAEDVLSRLTKQIEDRLPKEQKLSWAIKERLYDMEKELETIELQAMGLSKVESAQKRLRNHIQKTAEMYIEASVMSKEFFINTEEWEKQVRYVVDDFEELMKTEEGMIKLQEKFGGQTKAVSKAIDLMAKLQESKIEQSYKRQIDYENQIFNIMRARGNTELDIAMKRLSYLDQINAGEQKIYDQSKTTADLLIKNIETQIKKVRGLYLEYEKGDKKKREELKKVMELIYEKTPEELATIMKAETPEEKGYIPFGQTKKQVMEDVETKQLVLDYWQYFSEEGKKSMLESLRVLREHPGLEIPTKIDMPSLEELERKLQIARIEPIPVRVEATIKLITDEMDIAKKTKKAVEEAIKENRTLKYLRDNV